MSGANVLLRHTHHVSYSTRLG